MSGSAEASPPGFGALDHPDAIRARLERVGDPLGDFAAGASGGTVPAAVLVPLLAPPPTTRVLFTKRSRKLRDHAGQVSFPGGRVEPADPDPVRTALREAEEEISLAPERVEILGMLPPQDTATGFRVLPVVAWIEDPGRLRPEPSEVEEIFLLPLERVLDLGRYRRESYLRDGERRWYYVLDHERHRIWGATAAILHRFATVLGDRGR